MYSTEFQLISFSSYFNTLIVYILGGLKALLLLCHDLNVLYRISANFFFFLLLLFSYFDFVYPR